MIELRNVSLSYNRREILDKVSLRTERGKITAILGPSGSGKSTSLKLMLGLIRPDSGSVLVDGVDITRMPEQALFPIRKKMGMVFQGNALFDSLNVTDNLAFFLRENMNLPEHAIAARVRDQVAFAGLQGYERQLPDSLSGGMRKRLAIGRALIFGPEMILLDEPTVGLDPVSTKRVLDVIIGLREEKGLGAVIVTHLINDVFTLADRVVVLFQKRIAFDGTVDEMAESDHPFIQSFMTNAEMV